MMTDLSKLLDAAHDQARKILLGKKDEQLCPMWVLVDNQDQWQVIGTPFDGPREKDLVVMLMKQMMEDKNTVAYSFLTEAWFTVLPPGTDVDTAPAPSKSPDRKEMVLALASDDTDTEFRSWHIKRDKRGRVTALPEEKLVECTMFGRFDGLLQKAH